MADYKQHVISQGDTLQSIAQRYYGNVNEWHTIKDYNNLKYPYIVKQGQEHIADPENVVMVGSTITIPIEQSLMDVNTDNFTRRDINNVLDLVLGRDLSMIDTPYDYAERGLQGEIFSLNSKNGDVSTVRGVQNLKQAVMARLLTPKGSLLLHPNYGSELHKIIGKNTTGVARIIEDEITKTILVDQRIANVYPEYSRIDFNVYEGKFVVELRSIEEYFDLLIESDPEGNYIVR